MTTSSTPIHTALLSYGMSGEVFHGPLLAAHRGFHLSKIVERKTDKSATRYPGAARVRNVDDVFQDPSTELIIVNTPNETHYSFAMRALQAGKHVVVEKPFTVTVREADELLSTAAKNNRVLTVFHNRRWDGGFLTLQDVLNKGSLGKICEFEAHYDRYRNQIEPHTWKEVTSPGTGILYNLGSHLIDQALVLFGKPQEVDARIGVRRAGGAVDDYYDIRLVYHDFLAILKSSYLVREPGPQYIIHGSEGSFVKYGIDPQEQALKDGMIPGTSGWGTEDESTWALLHDAAGRRRIPTVAGNYLAFYENLFQAIRLGKDLAVKAGDARDVIRVIEACYESNRAHRAIKI